MIKSEIILFAAMVLLGITVTLAYECLLLLKNYIRFHIITELLLEILFWGAAAVLTYRVQFLLNYGILRLFSFVSAALGAVIAYGLTKATYDSFAKILKRRRKRREKMQKLRRAARKKQVQKLLFRLKKVLRRVTIIINSLRKKKGAGTEDEKEQ